MTSDIDPQEFGRLQAEVQALRTNEERTAQALEKMAESLDAIKVQLAEARGGWKTLLLVGGAAGTVGAALAKAAMWLGKLPA